MALLVHALFAAGLALAGQYVQKQPVEDVITVRFSVREVKPTPRIAPEVEPTLSLRTEPAVAPPRDAPKVREPAAAPSPKLAPTSEAVAPGPATDEPPAPEYVYRFDGPATAGPGLAVAGGQSRGSLYGVKGGRGSGKGGGGDDDATGIAVAPVTAIATMPVSVGDVDRLSNYNYPEAARKHGIEGDVVISLIVDEQGGVHSVRVVTGLGFGLDEEAKKLARKLSFRPALDTRQNPIAVRIPWTFKFTLPK